MRQGGEQVRLSVRIRSPAARGHALAYVRAGRKLVPKIVLG